MTYTTSSIQIVQQMASTTGQIVHDSIPLFTYFLGIIVTFFVLGLILKAIKQIKKVLK